MKILNGKKSPQAGVKWRYVSMLLVYVEFYVALNINR